MNMFKKFFEITTIILLAILSSVNYSIFVFPNSFAPAGIDGICTMIQDITKVSMGYLSLIINIPLLIITYIFLNRDFAIKSTIYVLSFSISILILKNSNIYLFSYYTETGTSIVLAPITAGTLRGILYFFTLKLNSSSGGTDLIASIVKKKKPHLNLMNTIFSINLIVALSSFFVYDFKIEPVICSIIYSFITSKISNTIQSKEKQTIKFEIITSDYEKLYKEILNNFQYIPLIMDSKDTYLYKNRKLVVCVIDKNKVPTFENLLLAFPNTVVFKSIVNNYITSAEYKYI